MEYEKLADVLLQDLADLEEFAINLQDVAVSSELKKASRFLQDACQDFFIEIETVVKEQFVS